MGSRMGTVNFSVSEEIKKAFNKAFAGENKSAVLARLMKQAIDERVRHKQRAQAFRLLVEGRKNRPKLSDKKLHRLRKESRA
jgi:hypothetical protein